MAKLHNAKQTLEFEIPMENQFHLLHDEIEEAQKNKNDSKMAEKTDKKRIKKGR